jgi:hypothetical protein
LSLRRFRRSHVTSQNYFSIKSELVDLLWLACTRGYLRVVPTQANAVQGSACAWHPPNQPHTNLLSLYQWHRGIGFRVGQNHIRYICIYIRWMYIISSREINEYTIIYRVGPNRISIYTPYKYVPYIYVCINKFSVPVFVYTVCEF